MGETGSRNNTRRLEPQRCYNSIRMLHRHLNHSNWTLAAIDDSNRSFPISVIPVRFAWRQVSSAMAHSIKILLCVTFFASVFALAQTQTKLIEWQERPLGSNNERWEEGTEVFRVLESVEIESFTVGEKAITIGKEFSADDDWLRDLVIRVRNVSGQKVVAIQVTLVLPQIGPGSPDVVYCYGCAPEEMAKGIAAGESVELKMPGGGFYDFVKIRAVEKGGISQISKAQIRLMFVTLPDSKRWVSGCIKTTDAKTSCPQLRQQ